MTNPSPLPSIALSIRQPWATLIAHGFKDVENRSRCIKKFCGPFLINASAGMTSAEYVECFKFLRERNLHDAAQFLERVGRLDRGGIVGVAHIFSHGNIALRSAWYVSVGENPWGTDGYWYQIKDAKPLPFTPCKARLGFFTVPDSVSAALRLCV